MNFVRKYIWLFILGIVLALGGTVYAVQAQQALEQAQSYETTPAERGVLVAQVEATGSLRPRQSALLTWQTSGRVEAVNVSAGQAVKAEETLARLAPGSLPQGIILAEADLVAAQQALDALVQSDLAVAQAQRSLADARRLVEEAQDDYDRLARPRVSDELVDDTEKQIDDLKSRLKFQNWVFDRFFDGYYEGNPRKAQQIIGISSTQEQIDALTARLVWYTSKATELQVEQALAQLNVATAKMEDAQRELDRLAGTGKAADIAAAQARVDAAFSTLNLANLPAPFAGTVTRVDALPGDMVSAGQAAFQLEDLSELFVEIGVSEIDINAIALGQPASIFFDAAPTKTYTGEVTKMNLAGEPGEGGVLFTVTVRITDADEQIRSGMTASVTITTKEVADALLIPNRAVRYINGEPVVYLLQGQEAVAAPVQLGATANSYSEVLAGEVNPGDLIILNPPSP